VKLKFALLFSVLFILLDIRTVYADVLPPEKVIVRPNVIVSATIGTPRMTLWGYGAPFSVIELSGIGVDQSVISGANGYYSFDLVYLNTSFPELCVTAIDRGKRITPPTCIPPIGHGNYFYNVGPVILPPTISLGTPQTNEDGQVSAQGETIPNSNVEVKLGRPDAKPGIFGFQPIRSVLAYYIPSYSVLSDAEGNFSFNMPANGNLSWRVFAITDYEGGNKSPKSNTLKFKTLTPAAYAWSNFLAFLGTFLVWPRIIILEILVILILTGIALAIIKRKRGKNKKVEANRNDQKYSELVERYQEFLKKTKPIQ